MSVRRYQDLIVWQKAMDLALMVYEATENFPQKEIFGLTNQLRRAAVSVPSDIAEGQGRETTRDFLRFLGIARGSLQELETQLMLASRLRYIDESGKAAVFEVAEETGRLLSGLCKSLSRTDNGPLDGLP
jgi:four helix bundle protein